MNESTRDGLKLLAIVGLGVLAAVTYGILHDQVTARVCVEYFTIAHPPVFDTEDPTLLALGWGVLATWWVGFPLGVALALAARAGNRPKRSVRSLVRPVLGLLAVMAVCALVAGVTGYILAKRGSVALDPYWRVVIPPERQAGFVADSWAHLTSYFLGFVGGVTVIAQVWRSRARLPRE